MEICKDGCIKTRNHIIYIRCRNEQLYNYKTTLFFAVENNNIPLTKYLLANGADRNIKDDQGNTAFMYAETPEMMNI